MRKRALCLGLIATIALTVGCAKHVAAPVPGAINVFDSTSYRTLVDAQAAIQSVKADVANGKKTLNPTEKAVLNQAIQDYNIAQAAWQAYHAGATQDTTTLASAINQLVLDIAGIASKIGGK